MRSPAFCQPPAGVAETLPLVLRRALETMTRPNVELVACEGPSGEFGGYFERI